MSAPKVVHCKRSRFDVYIGRETQDLKASKWANQFRITPNRTRAQVIADYRAHLLATPALMAALPELRGKVLGCWCAPLACHGDVLLELANKPADDQPTQQDGEL